MGRSLETDWLTKTQRVFHEDSDGFLIETVADVTDAVEESKTLYNTFAHKSAQKFKGDGFHHVAQIPMSVIYEYKQRTGVDLLTCDDAELKRFLNDRDNLVFRTRPGAV